MQPIKPADWSALPPHLRADPHIIHMRLDNHEARITDLEARPSFPDIERLPWRELSIMGALLALGLTGNASLIPRLFGGG